MSNLVDQWFSENILPLEAELDGFLMRRTDDLSEVADLRQDVLMRVYKAAETGLPHNPRAFLYATARNLLIDRIRRQRVVSIDLVMDIDAVYVPDEEAGPFETTSSRQELAMLQAALETLPDRTRAVILMRRAQGLSQRETAKALAVSEPTVERHISRGVRLLAEALKCQGVRRPSKPAAPGRRGRRHER